jgi:hypothetical protein
MGHAIHYQLFNTKKFNFSDDNKSDVAYLNHKEDFAEAFAEMIININNNVSLTKRDQEMRSVLDSL